MSVISEIIRIEDDNSISFGNYHTTEKQKLDNFQFGESIYKVKTYNEVTRIKKDGTLLLETVPGSTIHNFNKDEKEVTFTIEGFENTNIIMQLESDTAYRITTNNQNLGSMKSNLSGKISFALNLSNSSQNIKIEKL